MNTNQGKPVVKVVKVLYPTTKTPRPQSFLKVDGKEIY